MKLTFKDFCILSTTASLWCQCKLWKRNVTYEVQYLLQHTGMYNQGATMCILLDIVIILELLHMSQIKKYNCVAKKLCIQNNKIEIFINKNISATEYLTLKHPRNKHYDRFLGTTIVWYKKKLFINKSNCCAKQDKINSSCIS